MNIDDVIREEMTAERAIREILVDLQARTGRLVEWVKVDTRGDLKVTVNTVKKIGARHGSQSNEQRD